MQPILSPNSTGFVLRATAGVVLMSALAAQAQTQNAASLPSVTVQSSRSSAEMPARKTVEQEREQLAQVPGGTNLAEPQKEARLATLRDALDYQPGIVLQDFFGGTDQPRLGIRGSGIQSNPVNRGVLLIRQGQYEGAAEDLRAAIALDGAGFQPYLNLAQAYQALKRWDDAAAALDAAVERAPDIAAVYESRARVHLERKRRAAARADLERAVA
ncbi:MAG TPA: tetratricopeptide repeat protein, partial [Giesbergeria sp.]|nr:tetratricopeptide repeat protein [Giesbergeria sp.]